MQKLHEIKLSEEFKSIYLLPISDLHIGDPHCNLDKFYRYRKWVEETPNAYVLVNGDIMNTAIKASVSDVYSETLNATEQIKLAEKIFAPIKDRILAVTKGNHENRIYKETGVDTVEVLCSKLGVYYAGDEAFLKICFGKNEHNKRQAYIVYMTHGWGAGRTAGAKVNNLQKLSDIVLADLYIASHTHFMTTHQDIYLVPDPRNNNIMQVKRTFVSSGAFLDRGGYAAQKGYPAAKLGSPRVRLEARRKDVHVSI